MAGGEEWSNRDEECRDAPSFVDGKEYSATDDGEEQLGAFGGHGDGFGVAEGPLDVKPKMSRMDTSWTLNHRSVSWIPAMQLL